jgi:uncharacterized protein (TIGR02266 family)
VPNRPTLLVVDEIRWFRELGESFLARSGRVISCGSSDQALEIARRERPDVVITDLDMPDRDGVELCSAIRSDPVLAYTPVVIVTGSRDPADHARAIRAGATDVLAKPLTRIALIESVARLTRFQEPQGRPRVDLAMPVKIDGADVWGTLRNLSRGGAFLETPAPLPSRGEVALEFQLPDAPRAVRSTAQVVWTRPARSRGAVGQGVRFLSLDRESIHALEQFVFAHSPSLETYLGGAA